MQHKHKYWTHPHAPVSRRRVIPSSLKHGPAEAFREFLRQRLWTNASPLEDWFLFLQTSFSQYSKAEDAWIFCCPRKRCLQIFKTQLQVLTEQDKFLKNSSSSISIYMASGWFTWTGIAQSVQRLATGWTVRGSNPGGGEIFRTRPDRPLGPPSLLYNGQRDSFPRVKRPGRGVDHSPHLAPRLKKE